MNKQIILILLVFILSFSLITLYLMVLSEANQAYALENNTSSKSNLTTNIQNISNNSTEKSASVSIPLKKPQFIKDE